MGDASGLDIPFDIERAEVLSEVPHGFFGSAGGAHQFGYGGPGEAEDTRKLRAAAAKAILPGAPLAAPFQVHSPEVVTLGKLWPDAASDRPVADSVVTARTDIVLGIVTADCCPILLADPIAGVVGAAHAGWRGALGNHRGSVIDNTVAAMEALGARRANIAAALGPTIAQSSYEVDAAFRDHFSIEDAPHFAAAPVRNGIDRWHFDLPGYVIARLRRAGLEKICDIRRDTLRESARFYSYRLATLNGQANYGRQLSAIAVP